MANVSTAMATSTATATTTAPCAPPTLHLKQSSEVLQDQDHDLSRLPAAEALRLLSANLETLVRITGDVPPTPPPRTPTDPQMTGLQAEKDIIARSSPGRTPPTPRRGDSQSSRDLSCVQAYSAAMTQQIHAAQAQAIDGVRLKTPSSPPLELQPYDVVTADDTPLNAQHGAITRKFYSKLEPPISITGYLARLHQFCPASAAVYLAASLYIHRLAVEERAIPVTRRNVHRLVLAGLRVATKALEDLAYPHAKVARVGGVSEAELARLEISFCFLAGFELVMGEERLRSHWEALKSDGVTEDEVNVPTLKLGKPKGLPTPGGTK